ncbi:hypothetical protein EGW08_000206 [Elysia chlorotica]|uniref:Glutathione S-transferase omega n=1 Tax=Elysia chlorotica TaxID=188477 RepID=A0A3S1I4G0_ELYCH|nr:hypothetical protein EGW08_000206 [Elysia chlorotica]
MSQKALGKDSSCPPAKPGVLRLYSMRFCPFAHRTRLVLNHKNIPHEEVNINLKEKPDWFLDLNPLGQVPVLQIDDKVIADSTATSEWLDDVYPENRLQPADPYRRAVDRGLLKYISKMNTTYYGAIFSTNADDLGEKMVELEKHLKFYEENLAAREEGPYFGGSQPSMFDFYFWPTYERYPMLALLKELPVVKVDPDKFPRLTSYGKAMVERPEVKAVAFDQATHATFFKSYISGAPDFDMCLEQ